MAHRPAVPSDISTDLLIECGHRCSVCGSPSPLERAHIVPWRKVKEHRVENMICLCANCHARADKEKWSQEVFQRYKREPWIFRHSGGGHPAFLAQRSTVSLRISMEIDDFSAREERLLRLAIAALLEIPAETVEVESVEAGSTLVGVRMPRTSAYHLLRLYKSKDPGLAEFLVPFGLIDVTISSKREFRLHHRRSLGRAAQVVLLIGAGYLSLRGFTNASLLDLVSAVAVALVASGLPYFSFFDE